MKPLIEFVAKSLVDDPTQVKVVETNRGKDVRIELTVGEDDMGRVIGRSGKVANAMRVLLRAAGTRRGVRATLDIL